MTQSIIHQSIAPSPCEDEGDWYGLYKGNTSQDDHLFDPASTRHPAKMSLPLVNRILDEMTARGWISDGSLIVDPFGGRGTSILAWLARHPANRGFSLELEPHFVEMQQKNKEHAERRLHRELAWVILQGDSRRFDEYYAEGKAASVLSAPYGDIELCDEQRHLRSWRTHEQKVADCKRLITKSNKDVAYGSTPGQIGNLPDSAITSAPYAMNDGTRGRKKSSREWDVERGYEHMAEGSEFRGDADYGSTPGNIGNLPDSAITSAPYADSINDSRDPDEKRARKAERYAKGEFACQRPDVFTSEKNQGAVASIGGHHSDTPGQIGRLKDPPAASVLSAPYENSPVAPCGAGGTQEWNKAYRKAQKTGNGEEFGKQMQQAKKTAGYGDAAVLSAPYAAAENRRAAGKVQEGEVSDAITRAYDATNHGQTDGQIANLPDKDVVAITSAPYGESQIAADLKSGSSVEERRQKRAAGNWDGYGSAPGNIANLPDKDAAAVTSAPWENSLGESAGVNIPQRERTAQVTGKSQAGVTPIDVRDRAAGTAEQKSYTDAAAVTSAPWEAIPGGGTPSPTGVLDQGVSERHMASRIGKTGGYADNQQGQIGVLQSETYAQACGLVYASLAKAGIRYVASVTKDPTRAGKLRPLRLLTIQLFEAAGYRLVAWRRAHLFTTQEEEDERMGQPSLFGEDVEGSKRLVGRLSFFRRLACARGGIAARWEDVLFFRLADPEEQQEPHPPRWVQPELF